MPQISKLIFKTSDNRVLIPVVIFRVTIYSLINFTKF
ncbi:hypothetical protein [Clostridioides difficile]|nr:hypothetical protein [Clostridioides difficile]